MAEEPRGSDPVAREMDGLEPVGLRERHKAATRAALQSSALELFGRLGFYATTTEMIAEAAGVSERTLFRYFESKDDLLLGEVAGVLGAVRAALARRPPFEPPVVAICEALVEVLAPRDFSLAWLASTDLVDPGRPRFRVRLIGALQAWESDIAVLLLARDEEGDRDGGGGGDEAAPARSVSDWPGRAFEASVIAAAATAALRTVLLRGTRPVKAGRSHAVPDGRLVSERLLRTAFEVLERGCRLSSREVRR